MTGEQLKEIGEQARAAQQLYFEAAAQVPPARNVAELATEARKLFFAYERALIAWSERGTAQ